MENNTTHQITAAEHFHKYANKYEANSGGATRLVAKYLAELSGPLPPSASILDNAAGTGIVLDELLSRVSNNNVRASLHITAVDAAPAMIEVLKARCHEQWKLQADQLVAKVVSAEAVAELPENGFSHSYTNFGFQFFQDPSKAAAAIHNTLSPGGVAYITTWSDVGYMGVLEQVSNRIRPEKPPLSIPFRQESFSETWIRELMTSAGFVSIKVQQTASRFSAADVGQMAEMLGDGFSTLARMQGWEEAEVSQLISTLRICLDSTDMVHNECGTVYIPMVAHVAICRKL